MAADLELEIPQFGRAAFDLIVAPLKAVSQTDFKLVHTVEMRCNVALGRRNEVVIDWSVVEEVATWCRALDARPIDSSGTAEHVLPETAAMASGFARLCARRAFARGDYSRCKVLCSVALKSAREGRRRIGSGASTVPPTGLDKAICAVSLAFLIYHEWGHVMFQANPLLGEIYAKNVLTLLRDFVKEDEAEGPFVSAIARRDEVLDVIDGSVAQPLGISLFAEEVYADGVGVGAAFLAARSNGLSRKREGMILGVLFGLFMHADAYDIFHSRADADPAGRHVDMEDVNARWFIRAGPAARGAILGSEPLAWLTPWSLPVTPPDFLRSQAIEGFNQGIAMFQAIGFLNPMIQYYAAPGEDERRQTARSPALSAERIARLKRTIASLGE